MSRVATLKESRKSARKALDALIAECDGYLATRALTPEETERLDAATKHVEDVDKAYRKAVKAEEAAAEFEAEKRAKTGNMEIEVKDGAVRVGKEPMTYSEANPDNSWFRDVYQVVGAGSNSPMAWNSAAGQRLQRHQQEVDGILRHGTATKEGRAYHNYARESRRYQAAEHRVDTGVGVDSMGVMSPPLFFLSTYAPYRVPGRTLIDNLRKRAMPETGMVFSVPKITTPTETVDQTAGTGNTGYLQTTGGTNTTVTTRNLASNYETGQVQTMINNILVSQQYLDRVGPGVSGDEIVRDDQLRQTNMTLDQYAWKSIFKNATTGHVAYTATSFTAAKFNQTVHTAKAVIERTPGTVAYPTHLITTPDLWETVEGAYDTTNRPFVVPTTVALNPLAFGNRTDTPEGFTGFKFAALPALVDQNAALAWYQYEHATHAATETQQVCLVGALDIAAWWLEATPVVRILPQPYAKTLTVLIQTYVYCAYIPQYPKAIQLVYGTGTALSSLTASTSSGEANTTVV